MAYTPNAKDMKTLSDAVLDNQMQISDLPQGAQAALQSYWGASGVDFSNPDTENKQLQDLIQQRRDQTSAGTIFDSPLFKPIEWAGSKLYWLYSKTVSPILSAGAMSLHSIIYGRPDYIGEDGEWDALKDYWSIAHHISPGQAIWELGMNSTELKGRGIRPDQMADDQAAQLAGTFKGEATKDDPFGMKSKSQKYFGSGGASQFVTGGTDVLVSWYLDPLVVGGKAASATKSVGFTKNVAKATKGGEKMDEFIAKPAFTRMVDTVMSVKKANPDNAALVLRRDMPTISKSANGDSLARLLSQAKDEDEVTDILRLSIGDNAARLPLEIQNAKLGPQIDQLTTRNVAHQSYYDALPDAIKASPRGQAIKAALDTQTKFVNDLNRQSRVIDDKLDAFASVDNMNFNRVTTPLGMKVRGSASFQDSQFKQVRGQGVIKAAGALVYNSTIGWPIKVVRSYNDIRPTAFLDIHAEDSYKALNASLQEVKGLSREGREMYVSRYIEASPNQRGEALMKMENQIAHRIVDRYNLGKPASNQVSYKLANDLYKDFASRRAAGQAAASKQQSYSAATMPDPLDPARTIRVASIDADGSRMVSTPLFDTQLANSHVLMDFGTFERALEAHGSAFMKLKSQFGDGWYKTSQVADTLSTVWKFAQLFRLGYAPRALADDFLGQVARFGALAMVDRAAKGGKVMLQDFVRGKWASDSVEAARQTQGMLAQHIDELGVQQIAIKNELLRNQAAGKNTAALEQAMRDVTDEIATARQTHADYGSLVNYGAQMRDVKIGRQVFSAPFGGKQGELYRDLAAGQRNFNNLMGAQADWYLKRMRRSDWENITPEMKGPEVHMDAWMRHVNDQIGQSSIGRQALAGASESELVKWMRSTAEGQKYRADIGLKNMPDYELAQRVKGAVDYVLDPALPGMDAIRASILQGKLEKSMLEAIPVRNRPMINAQTFDYAQGTHPVAQLLDKGITGYYNLANQMPAAKLLRNPLFGQSYKAHLADQMKILKGQGVTRIDEDLRKTMEKNARRGALDDVKKFTFTMDHETKMAYAMRHFGAFFGAQQESWNRWSRIISDDPSVLAHVAMTYGAPSRAGMVVDQDGNPVDGAGYSVDPTTGERKLVDYSERKMLIQIPEYLGGKQLNKELGLDPEASFTVPMSSAEIVLNHGDGALPVGAGPYVQMAVNHFAKEDPNTADWAQKMGVLPMGPQDSILDFVNPTTGKRLGDSTDDMSATKQRALFYMMQVENYKYEQHLRKTQPTWKELKERADRWTIFRTAAAFALPFSVNGQDPYQFFRDEFQRYQKLDPDSADEKFYDKYGDSFYMFSQSMSKNNSGLRPTAESVKMSKYYSDLIDKVGPQYAGIIVGAEGDGDYSQGAYYYQKTHATGVGSTDTQRTQMSARDAWKSAQVARGWRQYNSLMEDANAQLFDRGLSTFDDPGAEDLKNYKRGIQLMLTIQTMPDGKENPFYNEAWEQEFNSLDKGKYDRTAFDLGKVVDDPELWSKAVGPDGTVGIRSDIYTLKGYLAYRKEMQKALLIRKMNGGSLDITAQSNYDLKNSWDKTVLALIESDTKFAWLHSRYFATDMGFNLDTQLSSEEQQRLQQSDASVVGQEATNYSDESNNMFDVMDQKSGGLGG